MSQLTAGARTGRVKLFFDPFTVSTATGFSTGVSKSSALPGGPVLGLLRNPTDRTLYPVNSFGGALTPRTLTPVRGTSSGGSLTMNTVATSYSTATAVWRGLLTHFITAPVAVDTPIPAQLAEFGYFSQHIDPYCGTSVMLAIYTVDASGAVVDRLHDLDTVVGGGDGTDNTGNRLVWVPLQAGRIPAGGRLVVELWYHAEVGTPGDSAVAITFTCGGWNDKIPPHGMGAITELQPLSGTCASYIAIAGLSSGTVFDAMRDAAQPTRVRHRWATAVIPSRSGSEQRVMLRDTPAELLDVAFGGIDSVTSPAESARLDALLRANDETGYRLPWWPDVQMLAADLPHGSVVVPINTVGIDFTPTGEVIFYERPGVWELGTVQSIDSGSQLTLAAGTLADWPAGTAILPVKRAVLTDDHDVSRASPVVSRSAVTFRVLPSAPAGIGP